MSYDTDFWRPVWPPEKIEDTEQGNAPNAIPDKFQVPTKDSLNRARDRAFANIAPRLKDNPTFGNLEWEDPGYGSSRRGGGNGQDEEREPQRTDPDFWSPVEYELKKPQKQPEEDPTWEDYGRMVASGGVALAAGLGWGIKKLGADKLGEALQDSSNEVVQKLMEGLSPQAKEAMQTAFLERDDGELWTSNKWNRAKLQTFQSIIGTAGGMGVGSLLTRGLAKAGMSKAVTTAAGQTIQAPTKTAGAIGYGLGEASVAAPTAGGGAEAEVRAMTHEQLMQESIEYVALYENADPALSEEQRREMAKGKVADAVGGSAAGMTALTTFMLSAPAGAVLSKYLGGARAAESGGRIAGGFKGAGTETAQEFAQSGAEKLSENLALRVAGGFENQALGEGVLEDAVGGALSGTMMGGTMGVIATPSGPAPTTEDTDDRATPPLQGGTTPLADTNIETPQEGVSEAERAALDLDEQLKVETAPQSVAPEVGQASTQETSPSPETPATPVAADPIAQEEATVAAALKAQAEQEEAEENARLAAREAEGLGVSGTTATIDATETTEETDKVTEKEAEAQFKEFTARQKKENLPGFRKAARAFAKDIAARFPDIKLPLVSGRIGAPALGKYFEALQSKAGLTEIYPEFKADLAKVTGAKDVAGAVQALNDIKVKIQATAEPIPRGEQGSMQEQVRLGINAYDSFKADKTGDTPVRQQTATAIDELATVVEALVEEANQFGISLGPEILGEATHRVRRKIEGAKPGETQTHMVDIPAVREPDARVQTYIERARGMRDDADTYHSRVTKGGAGSATNDWGSAKEGSLAITGQYLRNAAVNIAALLPTTAGTNRSEADSKAKATPSSPVTAAPVEAKTETAGKKARKASKKQAAKKAASEKPAVKPAKKAKARTVEELIHVPVKEMSYQELRRYASHLGVNSKGTAENIRERIAEWDNKTTEAANKPEPVVTTAKEKVKAKAAEKKLKSKNAPKAVEAKAPGKKKSEVAAVKGGKKYQRINPETGVLEEEDGFTGLWNPVDKGPQPPSYMVIDATEETSAGHQAVGVGVAHSVHATFKEAELAIKKMRLKGVKGRLAIEGFSEEEGPTTTYFGKQRNAATSEIEEAVKEDKERAKKPKLVKKPETEEEILTEEEDTRQWQARRIPKQYRSDEYFFHEVVNDEDIASITEEGLRPGTNVSRLGGQALETEGGTVLVFKGKTGGKKSYQADELATGGEKPVAIIKDTTVDERAAVSLEEVSDRYVALQDELNMLAESWGIAPLELEKHIDTLASGSEDFVTASERKAALESLKKAGLDDIAMKRAKSLGQRMKKAVDIVTTTTEDIPGVTAEDVLNRYTRHGVPVFSTTGKKLAATNNPDPDKVIDVVKEAPIFQGRGAVATANEIEALTGQPIERGKGLTDNILASVGIPKEAGVVLRNLADNLSPNNRKRLIAAVKDYDGDKLNFAAELYDITNGGITLEAVNEMLTFTQQLREREAGVSAEDEELNARLQDEEAQRLGFANWKQMLELQEETTNTEEEGEQAERDYDAAWDEDESRWMATPFDLVGYGKEKVMLARAMLRKNKLASFISDRMGRSGVNKPAPVNMGELLDQFIEALPNNSRFYQLAKRLKETGVNIPVIIQDALIPGPDGVMAHGQYYTGGNKYRNEAESLYADIKNIRQALEADTREDDASATIHGRSTKNVNLAAHLIEEALRITASKKAEKYAHVIEDYVSRAKSHLEKVDEQYQPQNSRWNYSKSYIRIAMPEPAGGYTTDSYYDFFLTTMHEMVHAATYAKYRENAVFRGRINKLLEIARADAIAKGQKVEDVYGLKDGGEFIAEALANASFQNILAQIPTRNPNSNKISNALKDFLDAIKRMLGYSIRNTVLEDVLVLVDKNMQTEAEVIESFKQLNARGVKATIVNNEINPNKRNASRDAIDAVKTTAPQLFDDTGSKLFEMKERIKRGFSSKDQIERDARALFDRAAAALNMSNPMTRWIKAKNSAGALAREFENKAAPLFKEFRKLNLQTINKAHILMRDISMTSVWADKPLNHPDNAHLWGKVRKNGTRHLLPSKKKEAEYARRQFVQFADEHPAAAKIVSKMARLTREIHDKKISTSLFALAESFGFDAKTIKAFENAKTVEDIDKIVPPNGVMSDNISAQIEKAVGKEEIKRLKDIRATATAREKAADRAKTILKMSYIQGMYFPARRYGDYVVSTGPDELDADKYVSFHATETEANRYAALLNKDGGPKVYASVKLKATSAANDVATVVAELTQNMPNDENRAALNSAFAQVLASKATYASQLRRNNVEGLAAQDMGKAFEEYVQISKYQIGDMLVAHRLKAALNDINTVLRNEEGTLQGKDLVRANVFKSEIDKHNKNEAADREMHLYQRVLGTVGFLNYLGAPSYWLLNATQTYVVTIPYLGAKYGLGANGALLSAQGNVLSAVTKAMQSSDKTYEGFKKQLNPDARALVEKLEEQNVIQSTIAHNMGDMLTPSSYNWMRKKAAGRPVASTLEFSMDLMQTVPEAIEHYNRISTALATYQLSGGDLAATVDAVNETQFNYDTANRARLLKGKALTPIMMFKTFGFGMFRLFYGAAFSAIGGSKGGTKLTGAQRLEASKLAGGLMATHALFGGAAGGLMIAPVMAIQSIMNAMLEPDDEWDFVEGIGDFVAEVSNDYMATMAKRGVPAAVLGADFSRSINLGDLIWMSNDRADYSTAEGVAAQAANLVGGALGNYGTRAVSEGYRLFSGDTRGSWAKFAEAAVPLKLYRGVSQSIRYSNEGLETGSGLKLMTADEFNGALVTMLGLQSTSKVETQSEYYGDQNLEQRRNQRRMQLVKRLENRRSSGDDLSSVLNDIEKFNLSVPKRSMRITRGDRARLTSRKRKEQREYDRRYPK